MAAVIVAPATSIVFPGDGPVLIQPPGITVVPFAALALPGLSDRPVGLATSTPPAATAATSPSAPAILAAGAEVVRGPGLAVVRADRTIRSDGTIGIGMAARRVVTRRTLGPLGRTRLGMEILFAWCRGRAGWRNTEG